MNEELRVTFEGKNSELKTEFESKDAEVKAALTAALESKADELR